MIILGAAILLVAALLVCAVFATLWWSTTTVTATEPLPATATATRPVQTPTPTPTRPAPSPTAIPEAQPTVSPTPPPPQPTVSPTPPPPQPTVTTPPPTPPAQPVAVWESTLTLDTYGWDRALVPTAPDDPIFPYPRLNFDAVPGSIPREYRAVFIQNEYVQLVVLPDLGGRILRWSDRTTGRQLFYANPVVKPTRWGYRGWWLATGGMEWAFPVEEHGLNEYRPWSYELLADGVRVWNVEERTGMTVAVTVRLEPGSSRVAISPSIANPTGQPQPYQFWVNAMLTLSERNAPSPDLSFVLPASEVLVHSTGDGSLPGPGGAMSWPVYAGRDFGRYAEWHAYLGVFAPQAAQAGFAGAYDLGADQGIVRAAPTWLRGVKVFCLGDLPAELWTDDGSRYFELWGGLTSTFGTYATLDAGQSVGWTEYWYAVSGMGGYTWANAEAAARLTPAGDGVELAVETVRPLQATVILRQSGIEVARWSAPIGPGQPFRQTWGPGSGPWALEVLDGQGRIVIQFVR